MQAGCQNAVGTPAAPCCDVSIQRVKGRAELYTEMPVKVSGFKQLIDAGEWIITTLSHSLSADSGFTTSIELEVKIDSLEME